MEHSGRCGGRQVPARICWASVVPVVVVAALLSAPGSLAAGRLSSSGYDVTPLSKEEVARLAAPLTRDQRYVALQGGTERPFRNLYHDNRAEGVYVSAIGGLPLFSSKAKYDSGTGWPSFYEPLDPEHVVEVEDNGWIHRRTEVQDARSRAHLGHVFPDGPPPTGLRYCMNSAALVFVPQAESEAQQAQQQGHAARGALADEEEDEEAGGEEDEEEEVEEEGDGWEETEARRELLDADDGSYQDEDEDDEKEMEEWMAQRREARAAREAARAGAREAD